MGGSRPKSDQLLVLLEQRTGCLFLHSNGFESGLERGHVGNIVLVGIQTEEKREDDIKIPIDWWIENPLHSLWNVELLEFSFRVVAKLIGSIPHTIPTTISSCVRIRSLDDERLAILQLTRLLH